MGWRGNQLYEPTTKVTKKCRFRPHTSHKQLNRFWWNSNLRTTLKTTPVQNLIFDPTTWAVWANTQFVTVSVLCFFGLFVRRTGRPSETVLTVYTPHEVFPRTDVPFRGFVDITPIKGSKAQKRRGWIGIFTPNSQNIKICILLKLLCTPIANNFCTVSETTKCSSWVVETRVKQIQHGGWPPFWKKNKKWPYLRNDLTDRHEILQVTHIRPPNRAGS